MSKNNNTSTSAPKLNLVARFKADAESVKKAFQARFNKLVGTPAVLAGVAIGICCGGLAVASSAGDAVKQAEAARVAAIAEADKALAEADKALAVEKAKQGVPPTFLQSLYGVTVKPVADGTSYAYNGAKSLDGRAYNAVTSTFGSASSQSTEAPEVKVVAPAPAATK